MQQVYTMLDFEVPLIKILSDMEVNGIKVDKIYLKKLSKKFEDKLNTIEKDIYKLAKKKFNIASTKHLVRTTSTNLF